MDAGRHPLVLMHGMTSSVWAWDPVMPLLSKRSEPRAARRDECRLPAVVSPTGGMPEVTMLAGAGHVPMSDDPHLVAIATTLDFAARAESSMSDSDAFGERPVR